MRIKRRSFLQSIFAVAAGFAVKPTTIPTKSGFGPDWFDNLAEQMRAMWKKTFIGLNGPNGKEISGNGYARVQISGDDWDVDGCKIKNGREVTFPKATSDWGKVTGFFVADAKDNVLLYCQYPMYHRPRILAGNIARFTPGNIEVEFS